MVFEGFFLEIGYFAAGLGEFQWYFFHYKIDLFYINFHEKKGRESPTN
jgi:hypothetical protein